MPDNEKIPQREALMKKTSQARGKIWRCGAYLCGFCLFFVLFLFPVAGRPVEQENSEIFSTPYTHFSQQEPLSAVLADFARTQGYAATVSEKLDGNLSGHFEKVAAPAFLKSLERAFDLRWYLLDVTLHFYRADESRQALVAAQNLGSEKMKEQLLALGLVSAQLPLETSKAGNDLLTVRGPPAYVAQIQTAAQALETAANRNVMRVFKLKYASADDRTVESMGRSVTVPGVASILRAMVLGQNVAGSAGGTQPATVSKLKGTGLAATGKENSAGGAGQGQAPNSPAADATGDTALPGLLSIVADPRMNAVVVQDTLSRMPYYETVIADLDRATHLVEIHAAIVDIDSEFKRDLGVEWQGDYTSEGGKGAQGDRGSSLEINTPDGSSGNLNGLIFSTIYTRGSNFFMAAIQAMEKNGAGRMLGRPSVLTAENLEATLENVTTYYVSVGGQEEVDLFKVEAGTVLRVTPHIIENEGGASSIRLAVTVQDDQEGSSGIEGSMAIRPIKQTKINTQAIIDEGQSLLIGGYYFEEKRESESGVPVLMHLPVLGNLFRTTTRETKQMERLVLITPRIVRLGETRRLPPQVTETDFGRAPGQADYAPVPETLEGGERNAP